MGKTKTALAGFLLAAFTATAGVTELQAQNAAPPSSSMPVSEVVEYANATHLAYIRTSSTSSNNITKAGLEVLAYTLAEKTIIEPAGVVGLNIEKDDIALFPFIYWEVPSNAAPLSEKAQKKVQSYLDTGGVILFNTSDNKALGRMLGNVSTKPLVPMKKDHTLTKTFYLTQGLPGSNDFGTILVEANDIETRDTVSSIIVGEHNWAAAWAGITASPDSEKWDMAMRSGINIVMYATSGNYKSDQIHTKSILERLEKR